MSSSNESSPEVRERAVRLVLEHQAGPMKCSGPRAGRLRRSSTATSETLRKWVRQGERDQGRRAGPRSAERERLKAMERENRELRRASEVPGKVSAYFAHAELDRRPGT